MFKKVVIDGLATITEDAAHIVSVKDGKDTRTIAYVFTVSRNLRTEPSEITDDHVH
jgi:hypothetical protein